MALEPPKTTTMTGTGTWMTKQTQNANTWRMSLQLEEDKPGKHKTHRYNNDNAKRGKIDGGVTLNTDENKIKEGKTTAKMMKI
eukprot:13542725-Ditylum_brightwellii.AAC.1